MTRRVSPTRASAFTSRRGWWSPTGSAPGYVQLVWFSLRQLVTGGASMDDVGGPVAIVSTITDVGMESQQQAEAHDQNGTLAAIRSIASFAALIAVNLAVMNLLPIPALDGGHILFLILDTLAAKLFRRRIPMKYEAAISSVFLVALMGFMLFVTAHDIFKLIECHDEANQRGPGARGRRRPGEHPVHVQYEDQ